MEFHSLRKGLIARTPRVTSCAGAAGVGSVFGMVAVYRWGVMRLERAGNGVFEGKFKSPDGDLSSGLLKLLVSW